MKILFISHASISPSYQEKLESLAEYSDAQLFLIIPRWWEEEARKIVFEKKDGSKITVISMPALFTGKQFIHFYIDLAACLKKINPDIIHIEEEPNSAVCFQAIWLKNRLKLKARVILFTWQNMFQTWHFPNPRALLYPFFENYVLKNTDYLIAGSKDSRDLFLKKGFSGGISILPQLGVDPDKFKKIDAGALKQKIGLNKFVIGYLGRLLKMKGAYTLLKAVSGLEEECQLLIIGGGRERKRLKIAARKLGIDKNTIFLQSIDNRKAPEYLNCMDVLVLASEHTNTWMEQFGRVLIEAMACEVPVVGSTCGEIPHIIEDAGLIFKEGDYEDLKTKLEKLIKDDKLRIKLVASGRQKVLNNFTTKIIVQRIHQIYLELLSGARPESDSGEMAGKLRFYYKTSVEYLLENISKHNEPYFKPYVSWAASHAPDGARILDLGCGNGLSSYLLSKKGLKATGLDISYLFLQQAGARGSRDLNYAAGDAMNLPFKDESFDAVSSISLIEHIPDARKALSEMMRVVKPGGVILIMAPNLLSPFVALKVFIQLCLRKGSAPGFASTKFQAIKWFFKNLAISCRKKASKKADFLYRKPDLSRGFTGDIDSVYLACQIDLKRFFTARGLKIEEYAHNTGLSFLETIIAKIFPNFCGACSIAVIKPTEPKILFITGAYPPLKDGIGDYTAMLAGRVAKSCGREVEIISSKDIRRWNVFGVAKIVRYVKNNDIDAVHIQYPSSRFRRAVTLAFLPLFIKLAFPKTKVITTLHEFSISYPINRFRQIVMSLFSDKVVVIDGKDFKRLAGSLPGVFIKNKLVVIPIGSNIGIYEPDAKKKEKFLKDHGLGPKTVIVSFFGFIHKNKGVEILLDALARLKNNKIPVFLMLIGELKPGDPYHRRIQHLLDSFEFKNSFYLTGYCAANEVSEFLSMSDLCALPFLDGVTFRRGTLISAIAHGLAVISTMADGYIPEGLIDGSNIVLIPTNNSKALAEAIASLCRDNALRKNIGMSAKGFSEKFSWDKIAASHIELYRSLRP